MSEPIITFENVQKLYGKKTHTVQAVAGASFSIRRGEAFGLVGESGSGKSTLGKMVIGLDEPTKGQVSYLGASLWEKKKFRRPSAGEMQIVFQDPQSSLDPRMTVQDIILEPLLALPQALRKEKGGRERLLALIKRVGLKEDHLSRHPHEFSGGQRQRIAIARALVTDPDFLILDEPTSALDVSVQAQVLNLLKELKRERNLTYLFISHNMSVIRYMCDRMAVMYKGHIVEIGPSREMFAEPRHPYTRILLSSLPSVHGDMAGTMGFAPETAGSASSCIFYSRCPQRQNLCRDVAPAFQEHGGWGSACHVAAEVEAHV